MVKTTSTKNDWMNATGHIDYNMTNDYTFRIILQKHNNVLKGLISSMMHISLEDIHTVEVTNPIHPGDSINDKEYVLDVKVNLNDKSIINLEMQVVDEGNWANRSLLYLCRTFDNVQKGNDYNTVTAVTHIGFLDFDLFEDDEEFYSIYMLQNVKTGKIYNDKFRLNVLSLNKIENATDDDKKWNIDKWAKIFKAKTWEELKMIAKNNDVYTETMNAMMYVNADEIERQKAQAREDAIIHERYVQKQLKELKEARDQALSRERYAKVQLQDKDAQLQDKDIQLKDKDVQLHDQQVQLHNQQVQLQDKDALIKELQEKLAAVQ